MTNNQIRDGQELVRHAEREILYAEYLSVRAYAVKYGVTPRTVYTWIEKEAIDFYRKGRLIRVRDQRPDQAA